MHTMKGGSPAQLPAREHMRKDIEALYQAVQRTEAHSATINAHLDLLRAGHRNARGQSELRRKLESEIEYYTRQLGALHAERDQLRQKIADTRELPPAVRMRRDFKRWSKNDDEGKK